MSAQGAALVVVVALIPAAYVVFIRLFRRRCQRDAGASPYTEFEPDATPTGWLEIASLDCDGPCCRLMPHEIDGALARCVECDTQRITPLPLRAPARDAHIEDQP